MIDVFQIFTIAFSVIDENSMSFIIIVGHNILYNGWKYQRDGPIMFCPIFK